METKILENGGDLTEKKLNVQLFSGIGMDDVFEKLNIPKSAMCCRGKLISQLNMSDFYI